MGASLLALAKSIYYICFVCNHRNPSSFHCQIYTTTNHDTRICTRLFHCHQQSYLHFTWCHVRYFAVVGRYFRLVLQKKEAKDY